MKAQKILPVDAVLRQRVMHACTVAALCGVAWYFGVRQLEGRLVESTARFASLQGKANEYELLSKSDQRVRSRLANIKYGLEYVRLQSELTSDPTAIYDAIAKLAEVHNLTLESSNPSSGGGIATTPVPDSKEWPKVDMKATPLYNYVPASSGSRIGVMGEYADVARFLSACQTELGLSKVTEFQLNAIESEENELLVQASIDIQHLRFERVALEPPKPAATRRSRREK